MLEREVNQFEWQMKEIESLEGLVGCSCIAKSVIVSMQFRRIEFIYYEMLPTLAALSLTTERTCAAT